MTRILTELYIRDINNYRFIQLTAPFIFESDKLKEANLPYRVEIPAGFVYDMESVPIVRGSNNRGGTAHDYLCRIDSNPIVPKSLAASVYLEIMAYTYEIVDRGYWQHFKDFTKRWTKWFVVYAVPGYFYYHKFKVMATVEEISGVKGDPFVTIEKLDKAIVESEQATTAIKDVPAKVEGKADMVASSEQVTADLKDAKVEVKAEIPI
jgi:hypothetical protein